jgi:hypothetical protein
MLEIILVKEKCKRLHKSSNKIISHPYKTTNSPKEVISEDLAPSTTLEMNQKDNSSDWLAQINGEYGRWREILEVDYNNWLLSNDINGKESNYL